VRAASLRIKTRRGRPACRGIPADVTWNDGPAWCGICTALSRDMDFFLATLIRQRSASIVTVRPSLPQGLYSPLVEELEIDRLSHLAIARGIRVQMVAAVVRRIEFLRICRITNSCIKVNYAVETVR